LIKNHYKVFQPASCLQINDEKEVLKYRFLLEKSTEGTSNIFHPTIKF